MFFNTPFAGHALTSSVMKAQEADMTAFEAVTGRRDAA
jgi:hypothetical protein